MLVMSGVQLKCMLQVVVVPSACQPASRVWGCNWGRLTAEHREFYRFADEIGRSDVWGLQWVRIACPW